MKIITPWWIGNKNKLVFHHRLRSTGLDPANPTRLSLFIPFEVPGDHSDPWKGQIAGCMAPISREGVTVL